MWTPATQLKCVPVKHAARLVDLTLLPAAVELHGRDKHVSQGYFVFPFGLILCIHEPRFDRVNVNPLR